MLENLNPYNQSAFESEFRKTELYQKIEKDYKNVSFLKFFTDNRINYYATPRQLYGETWFSVTPFYYLQWLLETNPKNIYDLGCGWNIFKKYIPNIIGIGAESIDHRFYNADQQDYVDHDFIKRHKEYFESVFSINALHFTANNVAPTVGLSKLSTRVKDFYSMIAPKGRGFLALNLCRLLERESSELKKLSITDLEKYVRVQLSELDINFIVVDIDFATVDDWMDGNIRLVMAK